VASCALLAAGAAAGRDRRQLFFRLDVRSGAVAELSRLEPLAPVLRWPAPATDPRRFVTSRDRTLMLIEGEPDGAPATRKVTWQFTLPGTGAGMVRWTVLQGSTLTFLWREEARDQPRGYRDVVRAMDMDSRKILWERSYPMNEPPQGAGLGADHVAVDTEKEVQVLEKTTGRLVRRLAKSTPAFAVTSPGPGRVWMEAGDVIECVDEGSAKTLWRASKQGPLLWLLPLPGGDDWLMRTTGHLYRLRASDGRPAWSVDSTSSSRPLPTDGRIYEATFTVDDRRRSLLSVIARDLETGKALREYPLGRQDTFFDRLTVSVVAAKAGHVDVTAEYIVLD
jgi:outer membrane protein assembly factor BamB